MEQLCGGPVFERPNAAAGGRLGDVAGERGARKTTGLRERLEIEEVGQIKRHTGRA